MFIHARNPPYASAIKNNDPIKIIFAILLYRFLNIIVISITNIVQYVTKSNRFSVFIILVSAKFFCPKNQRRWVYMKSDPTMIMPSPNTLSVIQILIFFCEKIVFMIRIRTYTNTILVMMGRTIFTTKHLMINDIL